MPGDSHGTHASLALAQALLSHRELLNLDEPTHGLDPDGIHEIRDTIRHLHAEMGLTILLESHLPGEGEPLCSRAAVPRTANRWWEALNDGPMGTAGRGNPPLR